MKILSPLEVLTRCFEALPKADKARLKWHADNLTPIHCGPGSDVEYFSEKGRA